MAAPFPDEVRQFVEATTWRFAKTYAATWPHEYVVRTPENAAIILALAQHIFAHGVDGRFYSQVRKYHHEGGKVYWTMDSTPEGTQLVNRCDEAQTWEARLAAGTLPKKQGPNGLALVNEPASRWLPSWDFVRAAVKETRLGVGEPPVAIRE